MAALLRVLLIERTAQVSLLLPQLGDVPYNTSFSEGMEIILLLLFNSRSPFKNARKSNSNVRMSNSNARMSNSNVKKMRLKWL